MPDCWGFRLLQCEIALPMGLVQPVAREQPVNEPTTPIGAGHDDNRAICSNYGHAGRGIASVSLPVERLQRPTKTQVDLFPIEAKHRPNQKLRRSRAAPG